MDISSYFSIDTVVGATIVIVGNWAKSRIEGSIQHEYDKGLEKLKYELKRTDMLVTERMVIFKLLQKKLVSIRRYCESQINGERGSEFGNRPDDLDSADNKSILIHTTELEALVDENLIFLSDSCRKAFENLRDQLSLGASMELWLASPQQQLKFETSKIDGYEAISNKVDSCIDALYLDIGFPNKD
jgi:hypothetical protein